MSSMHITVQGTDSLRSNSKATAHPSHFSESEGLKVILSDALVVIPATIVTLGTCFGLLRDARMGADLGMSLFALSALVFSVGFAFNLLRSLYRFKVEHDDMDIQ